MLERLRLTNRGRQLGVQLTRRRRKTTCLFWSSVALASGRYHGQPMPKHLPLPVEARHFDRWLELFRQTARDVKRTPTFDQDNLPSGLRREHRTNTPDVPACHDPVLKWRRVVCFPCVRYRTVRCARDMLK